MKRCLLWTPCLLLALGLSASAVAGDPSPRLPADYALEPSEGSPGQVAFRHTTHVDPSAPSCVSCHPGNFRILEAGRTAGGERIQHEQMEKGRQCGACHGKSAFGLDRCDVCHGT